LNREGAGQSGTSPLLLNKQLALDRGGTEKSGIREEKSDKLFDDLAIRERKARSKGHATEPLKGHCSQGSGTTWKTTSEGKEKGLWP